jgi:hypothetical protein
LTLITHATTTIDHAVQLCEDHLYLHNFDLGPIGVVLYATSQWGLVPTDIFPLLEGASPATTAASNELGAVRKSIIASGAHPTNLDEVRNSSADAARAVDAFLERRRKMIASRYDIDGLTLAESPDVLFRRIMAAPLDTSLEGARLPTVQQRIAEV